MAVFLSVLKIIGITLLVLLGLILLLVLMLLFLPFRYDVSGRKNDDDLCFNGKVTWLKYIINAIAEYDKNTGVNYSVKLLFIKLLPAPSKEEASAKTSSGENKSKAVPSNTDTAESTSKDFSDKSEKSQNQNSDNQAASKAQSEADEKEYKSVYERLCDIYDSVAAIPDKIEKKIDKLKKIKADAELKKKYIDEKLQLLEDERFMAALKAVLKEIWVLLKKMKPVKGKGILYIGFEDPSNTGLFVAGYSIISPYIGELIELNTDFENEVFKGNFYFKGKFTLFMIIYCVVKAYMKDDLPYLLKKADI